MKGKHLLASIPIIFIILAGFWFRYMGIVDNLSFWNDEIHAAIFARGILWHGIPITETGASTGVYQSAFYYVTALFFQLFGLYEFAGRLPSVIIGTLLIVIIFTMVNTFVGKREAYVAAILMAFSQMQLAWSTQLRPYIWLEMFTLLIAYFSYRSIGNKKQMFDTSLNITIGLTLLSALFHGTGIINIILLGLVVAYKSISLKRYAYVISCIPLAIIAGIIVYFSLSPIHRKFESLLRFNFDIVHYRVFLQANYWWLIEGAVLGGLYLLKTNRKLLFILATFPIVIFTVAIFKINTGYVRYSLPAFPFLYILFAIGIVKLVDFFLIVIPHNRYKYGISVTIIVALLFLTTKTHKVLTTPRHYYTINGDMRENPIADYKAAFEKIRQLVNRDKNTIVMDAWNDRVPWFMPHHPFYFLIQYRVENTDSVFGEPLISTIAEYEQEKKKYTKGVVLIEEWESQTAPDLQQHIRNTLKKEFHSKHLPHNEGDPWSITVYSWGM